MKLLIIIYEIQFFQGVEFNVTAPRSQAGIVFEFKHLKWLSLIFVLVSHGFQQKNW